MNNTLFIMTPRERAQRGAALVVSLMFIVVLTLIGVSTMSTSTLELLMSGNTRLQTETLYSAEDALTAGEKRVDAIVTDPAGFDFAAVEDGFYESGEIDHLTTPLGTPATWSTLDAEAGPAAGQNYIVEYLGCRPLPGEPLDSCTRGIAGSHVHLYRVSARATSAKGAVQIVQSTYTTLEAP